MLNLFKKKEKAEENLVCKICSMEFRDRDRLERHKKIAHPKGR